VSAEEFWTVWAIFARWTVSYPGTGEFGRKLVIFLMAVSLAVSLMTLPVAWSATGWSVAFQLTSIANRGASVCLAFFLVLSLGFFYKFGGPVAPNLRKHTWSMAAFVTANALSYFAMSSHAFKLANFLLPTISMAALAFWILALTKAGEVEPEVAYDKEEYRAAEAMNRQLQKLASSVRLTSRGELGLQDGKLNPQDGKLNPQDGKLNPQDGKLNPQDGKLNPQEGKLNPQEGEPNLREKTQDEPGKPA
jgi:hypothetical protein